MSKILIVDDEPAVADTLALIMRYAGHESFVAYNGDSAMEQTRAVSPDVLVCDVVMPGTGGIEVAKFVRRLLPHCKILLCSGQATTTDLLAQARAHGDGFELWSKPFNPAMLIEWVRERCDGQK